MKSMIMNLRTLRAIHSEPLPYAEVLNFLATEREKTFDQHLLLMDDEAIARLPEEMRPGMMEMIKAAKARGVNENG